MESAGWRALQLPKYKCKQRDQEPSAALRRQTLPNLRFEIALLAPYSKCHDPQKESEEAAMKLQCVKNCLGNYSHENK